jgi:hypothetical protein
MGVAHQAGYSAAVRIYLEVNGDFFRVAQVGEDSLILGQPACELPPGTKGHVVIKVDGSRRVYPVILRRLVDGVWQFEDHGAIRLADYAIIASST